MDTCYIDTETTGLRAPYKLAGRRTWEIALLRVPEDDSPVRAAWVQIADVDLADADGTSLKIGRFHQRWRRSVGTRWDHTETIDGQTQKRYRGIDPATKEPVHTDEPRQVRLEVVEEADAAPVIEELTRGAVLAGSNPGFDALNFDQILERHNLPSELWHHHHRDVPNIATGYLRAQFEMDLGPDSPAEDGWTGATYSTRAISEAMGVPEPADRHGAWPDAVWMWRIDRIIRGIELPDVSARPNQGDSDTLPA